MVNHQTFKILLSFKYNLIFLGIECETIFFFLDTEFEVVNEQNLKQTTKSLIIPPLKDTHKSVHLYIHPVVGLEFFDINLSPSKK